MTSLGESTLQELIGRLQRAQETFAAHYPGEPATRQPVHTVYGGAHLFKSDTVKKLGEIALRSLSEYAPEPKTFAEAIGIREGLAGKVHARVQEKLRREAVEDFRIDFEDGYGNRPDAEEDGHAKQAAEEMAKGLEQGTLPPFVGIRIKTFSAEMGPRSLRTLDLYLTTLASRTGGKLPPGFVVTLPKVTSPEQVSVLDVGRHRIGEGVRPRVDGWLGRQLGAAVCQCHQCPPGECDAISRRRKQRGDVCLAQVQQRRMGVCAGHAGSILARPCIEWPGGAGAPPGMLSGGFAQALDVGHAGELRQRLRLELAHTLPGQSDLSADRLEQHRLTAVQPVAQLQDPPKPG